jgi:hypothetical protein
MAVGVASTSTIGTRFPGGVPRSDKYHKPTRADRQRRLFAVSLEHAHNLRCSFSCIGRLWRCWEMIDFLTHMPANTVIFITMAVLGLVGMLILLRRLI